eukprot:Nitzschia sp. Nitz4//scaffold6_size259037//164674//166857//NITZ4_001091-RA/size259037-processed-gene-0.25-mRNA-1//1//CDS//3329556944//3279//frame0
MEPDASLNDENVASDIVSKWGTREAYFFNHGASIAFWTLYASLNVAMTVWALWEFTPPHWITESDILRITLPIARAGGRLVTFNGAIILVSGSKWLLTMIRQHTVIPLGFPVDDIMPHYHRVIAWNIIQGGCILHTIPQIINYATGELAIVDGAPVWTWGDGFSSKQLLVTGIMLVVVFGIFFISTLEKVRHTSLGFRLFWIFHVGGILAAFPLLLIHGTILGYPITLYFLIVPLGIYSADCVIRRLVLVERETNVVEWSAHEDQGEKIVKLVLDGKHFNYTPGQYAELKIPEISHYEWHPFTIASAPKNRKSTVTFYIKASGRWTNQLYDLVATNTGYDTLKASMTVHLRGPHGAPAQNYLMYRHLMVIGSGIGVTPLLSIWQHLINESKELVCEPPKDSGSATPDKAAVEEEDETRLLNRLASQNINSVDVCNFTNARLISWKGKAAYVASILESMTVNISLFCMSVSLETVVFSVWVYEQDALASKMQVAVSSLALLTFGTKIMLSVVAYGPARYASSLVCVLECTILLMDLGSIVSSCTNLDSPSRSEAIAYFSFYATFLMVHAIRIFHIFYSTATPPSIQQPEAGSTSKKIHSITGVWVSRRFSSMSFAAMDLVSTLTRASPAFSLKFYATREKEDSIIEACQHRIYSGRPDWESLFHEAITKAHGTNPEGEAVGVFFCGAPAIARDLQRNAQLVTAQHQRAMELQTGHACKCRILVHKENF